MGFLRGRGDWLLNRQKRFGYGDSARDRFVRPASSDPVSYVQERRFRPGEDDVRSGSYRPVVVEDAPGGYVVREYDTYTRYKSKKARSKDVYLKSETFYDLDGNPVRTKRWRNDDGNIGLQLERDYQTGQGSYFSRAPNEPVGGARAPETYEEARRLQLAQQQRQRFTDRPSATEYRGQTYRAGTRQYFEGREATRRFQEYSALSDQGYRVRDAFPGQPAILEETGLRVRTDINVTRRSQPAGLLRSGYEETTYAREEGFSGRLPEQSQSYLLNRLQGRPTPGYFEYSSGRFGEFVIRREDTEVKVLPSRAGAIKESVIGRSMPIWNRVNLFGSQAIKGAVPGVGRLPAQIEAFGGIASKGYLAYGGAVQKALNLRRNPAQGFSETAIPFLARSGRNVASDAINRPVKYGLLFGGGYLTKTAVSAGTAGISRFGPSFARYAPKTVKALEYGGAGLFGLSVGMQAASGDERFLVTAAEGFTFGAGYGAAGRRAGQRQIAPLQEKLLGRSVSQRELVIFGQAARQRGLTVESVQAAPLRGWYLGVAAKNRVDLGAGLSAPARSATAEPIFGPARSFRNIRAVPYGKDYYLARADIKQMVRGENAEFVFRGRRNLILSNLQVRRMRKGYGFLDYGRTSKVYPFDYAGGATVRLEPVRAGLVPRTEGRLSPYDDAWEFNYLMRQVSIIEAKPPRAPEPSNGGGVVLEQPRMFGEGVRSSGRPSESRFEDLRPGRTVTVNRPLGESQRFRVIDEELPWIFQGAKVRSGLRSPLPSLKGFRQARYDRETVAFSGIAARSTSFLSRPVTARMLTPSVMSQRKPRQVTGAFPSIRIATLPSVRTDSRIKVSSLSGPRNISKSRFSPFSAEEMIELPPLVPFGLPRPSMMGAGAGSRSPKKKGRQYGYAPELSSLFFGIKAKKAPRTPRGGWTGFEIRPVVV